ncbi:hypothetical protein Tco_1446487, partial [Tanacetum coccineum]
YTRLGNQAFTPRTLRSPSKPDRVHICMISGAIPHLGRSGNGQPLQSSLTSVHRGPQSLINTGGNLPPNATQLSHNAHPFIPNNLQPPNRLMPTHVNLCSQPHMGVTLRSSLNYPHHAQNGNPSFGETSIQYFQ